MLDIVRLKFVALGDSLTVGFQSPDLFLPGKHEFPYTDLLEIILNSELPKKNLDGLEFYFKNCGMMGDTTQNMLKRFDIHVTALQPDYVIVWGGINDLFMFMSHERIFENLKNIYDRAAEADMKPIACTVTSILGFDSMIPNILKLNDMIKKHCKRQDVLIADLYAATSDETGKLRGSFSSDGIHLNNAGYRMVAYTIYYDVIESILDQSRMR